jgi:hypothetical protein
MPNSDYNNLRKDWIRESRNERKEAPQQPGATASEHDDAKSPAEARNIAEHRLGKTNKNTSDDRDISETRGGLPAEEE